MQCYMVPVEALVGGRAWMMLVMGLEVSARTASAMTIEGRLLVNACQ